MTRSALHLRLARRTPCPHCGRVSPTVQGVCADCWGSKGGQQFWIRKTGPSPDDPVLDWAAGYALVVGLALLPVVALVAVWILA